MSALATRPRPRRTNRSHDALGSVRKVTNSSGTVVANYDYDAWGNQLASTSDSIPNGGLQYRFVGGYGVRWDAATGLYYMRNRWYDPTLQRFVSRDPKDRGKIYMYGRNNPTRFIDPDGLAAISIQQGLAIAMSADRQEILKASKACNVPAAAIAAMLARERVNDSTSHSDPMYGEETNHSIVHAFGPASVHKDVYETHYGKGSWTVTWDGSPGPGMDHYTSIEAGACYLALLHSNIVKDGGCQKIKGFGTVPAGISQEEADWIAAIVQYNIGTGDYGGWGPYSQSVATAYDRYNQLTQGK